MKEILNLTKINHLKNVERRNSVKNRFENPAEHSWSSLILVDYFSKKIKAKIDINRVKEIITYHDVVEIYAGDNPQHPLIEGKSEEEQERLENEAAEKLREELPSEISDLFYNSFKEFQKQETMEAKFAKAIDAIDPIINGMNYKEKWKHLTKEWLIEHKQKYLKSFPEIEREILELIDFLDKEGYFGGEKKG